MDKTLLRSRKSSSSCWRIVGVMRDLMISLRFSRLMNKWPAPEDKGGRTHQQHAGRRTCYGALTGRGK